MALLTFPWGTVRSTAHGAMLNIRGRQFDLPIRDAECAIKFIEDIRMIVPYMLAHIGIGGPDLQLQWSINQKKIAKSILHVGLGNSAGRVVYTTGSTPFGSSWAPGTTPTILDFDEAMELAKALRVATKLTQPAAAATP